MSYPKVGFGFTKCTPEPFIEILLPVAGFSWTETDVVTLSGTVHIHGDTIATVWVEINGTPITEPVVIVGSTWSVSHTVTRGDVATPASIIAVAIGARGGTSQSLPVVGTVLPAPPWITGDCLCCYLPQVTDSVTTVAGRVSAMADLVPAEYWPPGKTQAWDVGQGVPGNRPIYALNVGTDLWEIIETSPVAKTLESAALAEITTLLGDSLQPWTICWAGRQGSMPYNCHMMCYQSTVTGYGGIGQISGLMQLWGVKNVGAAERNAHDTSIETTTRWIITFDGANWLRLYKNGIEVASNDVAGIVGAVTSLVAQVQVAAAATTGCAMFRGVVADIAALDRSMEDWMTSPLA